jgi:hypothetical protein
MNSYSGAAAFNRKNSGGSPTSISVSIPNKQFGCVDADCCDTQMLVQNYSNFKRSGSPARFMFYDNGSWAEFGADVVDSLRLGFEEGKAVVEVEFNGVIHLFELYRMLQVDLERGNQRSIAWIDVQGKCFFPKTFVDGNGKFSSYAAKVNEIVNLGDGVADGNKKIVIEISIGENHNPNFDSDSSAKKRKKGNEVIELEGSCSNSSDRPHGSKKSRMSNHDVESQSPWPKSKLLREGEKAYSIVKGLFLSGLGFVESDGAKITSIHQWMRGGPLDRARFEVFQKQLQITKVARGDANMTFAWYGTSAKGVASVLGHGFAVPSKVSGPESHGVGIYLSPIRSPHLSAMLSEVDDNGEKHIILCRVILGKCEKVEAGSRQMYPSGVDYDTGVDDLMNPKWYVVWSSNMNTHILPECVVSYRSSDFVPGQLGGPSFVESVPGSSNVLFAKLQSKIGTSLPSSRVKELGSLFSAYKDGKVPKHAFMKQLQSVVGDDMLASVIREVRG